MVLGWTGGLPGGILEGWVRMGEDFLGGLGSGRFGRPQFLGVARDSGRYPKGLIMRFLRAA